MPRCRLARLIHRAALVFVVMAAGLLTSGSAWGQGTMGVLPDPMSSRELLEYADRLGLSEQQRFAAEQLHDQYKARFRQLREGEIATFLEESRDFGQTMPTREQYEKLFRNLERIEAKIRTIDKAFFDQLQTVLTDEQIADLIRVRWARERDRLRSQNQMGGFGQFTNIDLSAMLLDVDLDAESSTGCSPILRTYERALTESLRESQEATRDMFGEMFDALEESQLLGSSVDDPETMQKMQEITMAIFRDLMAKQSERDAEQRARNEKTLSRLRDVLAADTFSKLHRRYLMRMYPEAAFAMDPGRDLFDRVLERGDLTDDQRESLQDAAIAHRARMKQLLKETTTVLDGQRSQMALALDFDQEAYQEQQLTLANLQGQAAERRAESTQVVVAIVGADATQRIRDAMNEETEAELGAIVHVGMGGMVVAAEAAAAEVAHEHAAEEAAWIGDQYVPQPIRSRDLLTFAAMLELDDDQVAILEELHGSYDEGTELIRHKEVQAVIDAVSHQWTFSEDGMASPKHGAGARVRQRRIEALEAIRALDRAFFDDVESAVLRAEQLDRMARVRAARDRQVFERSSGGTLDLSKLVIDRLDLEADENILVVLREYELASTTLLEAKYYADLDLQLANDRWFAEYSRRQRESGGEMAFDAHGYQEIMEEPQAAQRSANKAITTLNETTLEALTEAVPADRVNDLERAYAKAAYPNVFNDPGSIETQLDRASELVDLSPDQQQRLRDLAIEYRPAYRQCCDEMVAVNQRYRDPSMTIGFDQDDWKEYADRQSAMAQLAFDRSELNTRFGRRLKSILTTEQLERIGGLPKVPERAGHIIY